MVALVTYLLGLCFLINAAYEGGITILFRGKELGQRFDIAISLLLASSGFVITYIYGFHYFHNEIFPATFFLYSVTAVYSGTRNYFAR